MGLPIPNDGETLASFAVRYASDADVNAEWPTATADEKAEKAAAAYAAHEAERLASLGQTISDVEIFRVGTWNGDKYVAKDLDDMVAAFDGIGYRPPVKLGHKEDSGDPAYGWVASLKRVGDKLIATFEDIPDKLFTAIKNRQFDTVSSEIFWNIKRNGSTFRRALKAVAILGAEIPAVADLKPLRDSVEAFTGSDMSLVHSYTVSLHRKGKTQMPKNLKDAVARRTALQAELKDEQDASKITELQAELIGVTEKIEAFKDAEHEAKLAEAADKARGGDDAVKVASLQEEVEAMRTELAESREATRREKVTKRVADLTIPSLRNNIASLYDLATKADAGKVAFMTIDKDTGKKSTADVDPVNVVDDLVDRLNRFSDKLFSEHSIRGISERDEDPDPNESDDPGIEVDRRAKAHMAEHKGEYSDAVHAVLNADPALAKRYNA